MAFRYPLGIPEVNTAALNAVDPTGNDNQKAQNLFDLLKLDPRISQKPDRRVKKRNEAFQTATAFFDDEGRPVMLNQKPALAATP